MEQFTFKNQSESKKTERLHTVLSIKDNHCLIIGEETSEAGLGFVDKIVSLFALRKKLKAVRSETKSKNWSTAYPHV